MNAMRSREREGFLSSQPHCAKLDTAEAKLEWYVGSTRSEEAGTWNFSGG
jgi:hypothetical protein